MEDDQPVNNEDDAPACKVEGCTCEGFKQNPMLSTDCLICHHKWQDHRR